MRILLDTHVLLWALLNNPRLTDAQRQAIEQAAAEGELYLSSASVWEIGIKRAVGKLDVPDTLFKTAVDRGCRPLSISWVHAEAAAALPRHHNDPFDRMLVAQARCENMRLASSDKKLSAYDVELVT